jgi:AAA domain/AsnC-type helix-turn-helix domain
MEAIGAVMVDSNIRDLDAFLADPEPEYDWLVPGVIERGDRIILTGPEGGGKSTFLRQLAVQVGAGVHPFTGARITPARVLLLDVENGRRHVRRQMRALRAAAGVRLEPDHVFPIVRPAGLDLLEEADRGWLARVVDAVQPDLLVGGPLYKLGSGDPSSEEAAKPVARAIDDLRDAYDCAVILEAHQPYASNGGHRPERPYGASLWSRWPEFGLHLSEAGQLRHWRGDRDERDWPSALQRGGEWPWSVLTDPVAVTFARMLALVEEHGRLSYREIAERLGTSKTTVERAIQANRSEWDRRFAQLA